MNQIVPEYIGKVRGAVDKFSGNQCHEWVHRFKIKPYTVLSK